MCDSEPKPEIHLIFEDVLPYLQPDPPNVKKDIHQYLAKIKETTARFYVSRINSMYDSLHNVWPEGTSIDFFVAYDMFSKLSEEDFLEEMRNLNTRKLILEEVASRKKGLSQAQPSQPSQTNLDESSSDDDDDDDDDSDNSQRKRKKKMNSWTESEKATLIKALSRKNKLKTWRAVSKLFKNKTYEQCFLFYKKLLRKGEITSQYAPRKQLKIEGTLRHESSSDFSQFEHVKGLFLEYHDQKAVVGPQSDKNKDFARNSPLYGYTDLITCERMFLPAVSSHGTVLDYDTWIKIIHDQQRDPLEMLPVNNKRQITILTKDNFHLYQSQIRHLDEIRPKTDQFSEKL